MAGFALGNTVLLLFQLGLTSRDLVSDRGCIPNHGPSQGIVDSLKSASSNDRPNLKQHYCLAAKDPADVVQWEEWFKKKQVEVIGTMDWERGGRSVYFADPDGHVGEIGSRGIWPHY